MRLVAVDPGLTIGVVGYDTEAETCFCAEVRSVYVLHQLLDSYRPDVVIAEDFKLYPWRAKELSNQSLPAAEVLGAVTVWCAATNTELHRQPASVRKTVPARWLEEFGLHRLTIGRQHARDAVRHLVYYLARHRLVTLVIKKEEDERRCSKDCFQDTGAGSSGERCGEHRNNGRRGSRRNGTK